MFMTETKLLKQLKQLSSVYKNEFSSSKLNFESLSSLLGTDSVEVIKPNTTSQLP